MQFKRVRPARLFSSPYNNTTIINIPNIIKQINKHEETAYKNNYYEHAFFT